MSIFSQKTSSIEVTAANAAVSPQNFNVPPTLGEPKPAPHAAHEGQHRTISDRELSMVHACADFVCACIALPLSLFLLSQISTAPTNSIHLWRANTAQDAVFPIAVVIALALGGTYRVAHRRLQPNAFLEMRDLSFAVGAGCVLALAIGSMVHAFTQIAEPVATQIVLAGMAAVVVITAGRIVLRYFLRNLLKTRVLVVGAGKLVDRIMLSVRQDPGMELVGHIEDIDNPQMGSIGSTSDLPRLCAELAVDRVLVAFPGEVTDESLNTYRELQESVHIAMVPRYYELVSWRSRLTDLAGMPFLEIARPHLSPLDQFLKRAFDVCISSFFLIVTSPVLLVVAVAVKISSPGPVFFRQVRLGRHQIPFTITKFRTMTVGTELADRYTEDPGPHDPARPLHELRKKNDESDRITRVGAILRKTSIDEIPQFLNVFRGDMSIVGPRPFIPEESGVEGWGVRRFDVRPGITGLWQVSGRNDLTRSDLVQLDYLYVASWSLWWDLKIMWETPKTMARGTGAY